MKDSYDPVHVTIDKRGSDIITGLIIHEMGELAKMKEALEERGFSILCDINCRQIDLKYLLGIFSKAAE